MNAAPPGGLPPSYAEESLERVIEYVDGRMNRRAERLLKSRYLLMPAGLMLTLAFRAMVAAREQDPWILVGKRRKGAAR